MPTSSGPGFRHGGDYAQGRRAWPDVAWPASRRRPAQGPACSALSIGYRPLTD